VPTAQERRVSYTNCLAEITKAAGRPLSEDEIESLTEELQKRQKDKARLANQYDADRVVLEAADDYAKEMAAAAAIEKRNALINLRARMTALDFVRTQFPNDPILGLEALLVGVNSAKKGARNSAATQQDMLTAKYLGGFLADIETAGLLPIFTRGDLDADIARALWARDRDAPMPTSIPEQAVRIGEIIGKWQETTRLDANAAGAWIKKMPGYIVRQSHDMDKIRKAGFEAWKANILPKLDPKTFDGVTDVDKFLKKTWQGLASGVHLKVSDGPPTGFKGPGNIAKKASAERVLHFLGADEWTAYNSAFGTGNLREAVIRGMELSGQNTGLMRKLGTNPEANLKMIGEFLLRGIDDPALQNKLSTALNNGKLARQLRELDGTTRNPVNAMGAKISALARLLENITSLGGALLSSISDIATYASELSYQGRGFLSGTGEAVGGLFKGKNRAQMAELDGLIGVAMDSMKGSVASRFSLSDDVPGLASRVQQMFFKLNGMQWWGDTLRATATRSMAHYLAMNQGKAWGNLSPDLQRVLGLFGMDGPRWEVVRASVAKEVDGRGYVTPEGIMNVRNELVDPLIADKLAQIAKRDTTPEAKAKAADKARKDMRNEIADQVRSYYNDRAEYALLTPDQRTRAFMRQGTQPGTVEGELLRFIGQFKSFAAAIMQKTMGRDIYGRGSDTFGQALRNGNGEMYAVARTILMATTFGYVAMVAKDLAKGRTPREPDNPKTWAAALVQGGGLGIYGDFLFGEMKNRHGGGLITTMAGPVAGNIQDVADLFGRVKAGDDAAAAAFRTAISNVPFANLFYTRIVLDYLILWDIQEALSPGAMRRMEARIEKENAQTFLIRPSEVVR
jgi:hypothetical protein